VPRGELVLAVLGSANHDERHFEDPRALDLARDPNRHLAFGRGGAHHCLGAPLALMEGQIAINALLRWFSEARLAVLPESLRWLPGGVPARFGGAAAHPLGYRPVLATPGTVFPTDVAPAVGKYC
jgi:cytochrome P450